jgi:hypothetical protein
MSSHFITADSFRSFLHEFFHAFEMKLNIPNHGFWNENREKYFPAWKGTDEFDYYRWHFAGTFKKAGYDITFRNLPADYPQAAVTDQVKKRASLSLDKQINAHYQAQEALVLWRDQNKKTEARELFIQTRKINPFMFYFEKLFFPEGITDESLKLKQNKESLIPTAELKARASSQHLGYEAEKSIDGDSATMWHTEWDPLGKLPQSITIRLADINIVKNLFYLPRQDDNHNGIITKYEVLTSMDGITFHTVNKGNWADDKTEKNANFKQVKAAYIRLLALSASGGFASAAEISIGK